MSERKKVIRIPKYKYYFAFADLLMLSISFFITAYINRMLTGNSIDYSGIPILLVFLSMVLSYSYFSDSLNMYKLNVITARKEHTAAVSKAILYVTLIMAAASMFFFSFNLIRPGIALTFILVSFLMFYLFRIEIIPLVYKKLGIKRKILLIGEQEIHEGLTRGLSRERVPGVNIKQFVLFSDIIEKKQELEKLIEDLGIDEIILATNNGEYEQLIPMIEYLRRFNTSLRIISEKFRIIPERLSVEKLCGFSVIDFSRKYSDVHIKFFKRLTDIIFSVAALILLSPLLLLISLMIKLTSKGPVLFKQKRIGFGGKEFDFYKFRSMYVGKGEDEKRKQMMIDYMKNNKAQKIINDQRVTSIGKIIRRTSLDELPQLFNVLKGEMSLVGPRPCLPYEFENYEPWQRKRTEVIPGCTGIWQVSGRSSVSFTDSILLDLYYVNNRSPVLDLKLILKTIPVMVFSKGGK